MVARTETGRTYIEAGFLSRVAKFQQEYPVGAINMQALVVPGMGVRQALVKAYDRLKHSYPLPPKVAGQNQVLSPEYLERLDTEVDIAQTKQMDIKEIARSLSVPQRWVIGSIRRNNSRQVKEEDPMLALVESSRLRGIGGTAIAIQLNLPRISIQSLEKKLIKEGRIGKMRDRKTKAQVAVFDIAVKELREEEELWLRDEEISSALEATMGQTQSSIRRLIRLREIKPRPNFVSGQPR